MVTNWMLVWGGRGPLMSLFENMWKNNVVPVGIAQARVAYIYKGKGPMAEISGYRPISLISCIGFQALHPAVVWTHWFFSPLSL